MVRHGFPVISLVVLSILTVQNTARQIRQAPNSSTVKSLVNLPVDDLLIILKSRKGEAVQIPKQMTPCARAILSCCNDKMMNEACSESLKCGAYFFDDNPCEEKFLMDALKNAKYFYEQFSQGNTLTDSYS